MMVTTDLLPPPSHPAAEMRPINGWSALRRSSVFAHLSDEELTSMADRLETRVLQPGDVLMREGESATSAFLILEGTIEIVRPQGLQSIPIAMREPGDLIGEMSILTGEPRNATARAASTGRVLVIPATVFDDMLMASPLAMRSLLKTTTARMQSAEAQLVQHQKMSALGTLAAGLAHELNNPAAAVVRTAAHLRDAVHMLEAHASTVGGLALSDAEHLYLDAVRRDVEARAAVIPGMTAMTAMQRADQEADIEDLLVATGVRDAWRYVGTFVDSGWDATSLAAALGPVRGEWQQPVVLWLAAVEESQRLLRELGAAASAISEIVRAVKAYTHLDQSPVQDVDLHDGIEQSLLILRYKQHGVTVHRDYDRSLPRMTVFAGELNQVWTNLLDNALDALGGSGDIWVQTRADHAACKVEIRFVDSGPGIPEDLRQRVFEPFFTTKPPGQGTGLGLSISYSIIRRHGGDIVFESRPGRTSVIVLLPMNGVAA